MVAGGFHELHADKTGDEWNKQISSHIAKHVSPVGSLRSDQLNGRWVAEWKYSSDHRFNIAQ